jgi:N-acetylmuramate 1-kinase
MNRDELIAIFLGRNGFSPTNAAPLAQDASFRRYLRIRGDRPAVLMDAPPPEDVRPFLRIAAHLRGIGLRIPVVLATDEANGLVLQEDLGDDLVSLLLDRRAPPGPLLDAAVDALVVMQRSPPPDGLPPLGCADDDGDRDRHAVRLVVAGAVRRTGRPGRA